MTKNTRLQVAELEKLDIRIPITTGNSLSSYLFEICASLGRGEVFIWKSFHCGSKFTLRQKQIYKLDYDFATIHFERLSELTKCSTEQLQNLTFFPLYHKFFDNPYADYVRAMVMIQKEIVKNYRKYCPLCLNNEKGFNLLWQIKGFRMCLEHKVELQNSCPHCKQTILYHDNVLRLRRCPHSDCRGWLTECSSRITELEVLNEQSQLYHLWSFFLDPKKVLTKRVTTFSMEQSLAIKLLYVAQGFSEIYDRSKQIGISNPIAKSLTSFVRGNRAVKKVTLQLIVTIIRTRQLNIEQFAELEVPLSFVNTIYAEKKNEASGFCLAPWCKEYRKKQSMILIKKRVEPRRANLRYPNYYVCISCFLRYAYRPDNQMWNEVDNRIENVKMVRKLANKGLSKIEISRQLEINFYKVSEIIGYLAFRNLLDPSIENDYKPDVTPGNLAELFEMVQCDITTFPEKRFKKYKERFGWSLTEYSYFYANDTVQRFFLNKQSNLKKPIAKFNAIEKKANQVLQELIRSELRLSYEQTAAALECSESTLRAHGLSNIIEQAKSKQKSLHLHQEEKKLRGKVDHFILNAKDSEPLLLKEVFKTLGHQRDYIKNKYPGLLNYINGKVNTHNEIFQKRAWENKREEVKAAVQEVIKREPLNVTNVAQKVGIERPHVKGYSKIKALINEVIKEYSAV
ncbi:TniQ family protein [Paenibacillus sp. WQ 127069]|uniref:TniQ family protein n=1 Tax=Paenibacillus baimaensis TaxID=2982185 RepID=A0ABT2UJR3_9BACL|nr:TniQ family protein [Paenibacillus sp. WQ 127069]MCU6794858.1 TniQ family protein [Paenibacillus sp. WQ 127069]